MRSGRLSGRAGDSGGQRGRDGPVSEPAHHVRGARRHDRAGQGQPERSIGHNPLGAGSVFALLGFLLLQVASGLISDDEIATSGPLAKFVSNAMVSNATFYHQELGKPILIGLLVLHIGAVLFYLVKKRENLIRPMIRGDKETTMVAQNSRDDARSRTLAAALFLSCAALVASMVQLAG